MKKSAVQSGVRRIVKRVVPYKARDATWRLINLWRAVRSSKATAAARSSWDVATMQDLYGCCRLLLNRRPNEHELKGYGQQLRAGAMSLKTLTALFLDQPEFYDRQAQRAQSAAHPIVVDASGIRLYVDPENSIVGQGIQEQHSYETHVTAMLQRVLRPGMTVVDVGANIGYLSLIAARAVGNTGRVLCFEPDPYNCTLLQMSAALNGFETIEIFPFAVAERSKSMLYSAVHGTGVTTDLDFGAGDNGSAAGFPDLTSCRLVRAVSLDLMLRNEARIDVVKVDVDGAEAMVIGGAGETLEQQRPVLFSEFCPQLLEDISKVSGREYLNKLVDLDYDISILEFSGGVIDCAQDIDAVLRYVEEHNVIYIDLACFPRDSNTNNAGTIAARPES